MSAKLTVEVTVPLELVAAIKRNHRKNAYMYSSSYTQKLLTTAGAAVSESIRKLPLEFSDDSPLTLPRPTLYIPILPPAGPSQEIDIQAFGDDEKHFFDLRIQHSKTSLGTLNVHALDAVQFVVDQIGGNFPGGYLVLDHDGRRIYDTRWEEDDAMACKLKLAQLSIDENSIIDAEVAENMRNLR